MSSAVRKCSVRFHATKTIKRFKMFETDLKAGFKGNLYSIWKMVEFDDSATYLISAFFSRLPARPCLNL